jgi:hypothetical protein
VKQPNSNNPVKEASAATSAITFLETAVIYPDEPKPTSKAGREREISEQQGEAK